MINIYFIEWQFRHKITTCCDFNNVIQGQYCGKTKTIVICNLKQLLI